MMKLAVDGAARARRRTRRWWGPGGVWLTLVLCGLFLAGVAACTVESPPGEPIDFEALPHFKPFDLKTVDGEGRVLGDYLDRLTLVSFFFPT
jgi:hypothetical protein